MYHYIAIVKGNAHNRQIEYIRWWECISPEMAIKLFNKEHGNDPNYILKKIVCCPANAENFNLTNHLPFVNQYSCGCLKYD